MNAKAPRGKAIHHAAALAFALAFQSGSASADTAPRLEDVRCSNVALSLSPGGNGLVAYNAQPAKRMFVSTAPFEPKPEYLYLGTFSAEHFWSGDKRIVARNRDGHFVWDVLKRKGDLVRYAEPGRMFPRVSHGTDVLPRFVGAEYFTLSDGFSRNIRAVDIETGRTRLVHEGSPGATYTDHFYIGPNGKEIARISRVREGEDDGHLNFPQGRRSVPMRGGDKIEPLFTSESTALSKRGRLLALRTSRTGQRDLVAFDRASSSARVLRSIDGEGAVDVGVSSDGERVEWIGRDGPLPSTTFLEDAPRALVDFVAQFPQSRLTFESQSANGRVRLFKLTERAGGTRFYRLTKNGGQEFAVPCRQLSKAS